MNSNRKSGFRACQSYPISDLTTQVSGSCRTLSLASDLKSLAVITEVKSSEGHAEICFVQVRTVTGGVSCRHSPPSTDPPPSVFLFSQLDTGLLSDCLPELTRMARKFTHISTLLQYLHLSLTCMCEAWEEILMQMDLRLTKFVQVGSLGFRSFPFAPFAA